MLLAHLELIEYPWSGVRPSSSTISNMNISATSGPITMKFYQKHHWDEEKAALAGNDDMHGSSEEFKIQPDPTTDSCP